MNDRSRFTFAWFFCVCSKMPLQSDSWWQEEDKLGYQKFVGYFQETHKKHWYWHPHCQKISNCVQKFNFQKNNRIVNLNFCAKNQAIIVILMHWFLLEIEFSRQKWSKLNIFDYCWLCTNLKSRSLARKFKVSL